MAEGLPYTSLQSSNGGYMKRRIQSIANLLSVSLVLFASYSPAQPTQGPDLEFDHNHTFAEVVHYLNDVAGAYPNITKLHTIGKSYLGKDLLVLEITNQSTGAGKEKPGYWLDGNLHAGEVMGAESIWAVVEKLGVERVGHGVRAYEDPQLVSLLKERQIPLEMCVISNVRTGVCRSIEAHPIKQYYLQGLMVTVNSDDPTMFNTSISEEYLVLVQKLGFTMRDLKCLSMNSIDASFMPDEDKKRMKSHFEKEWQQLIEEHR